MTGGEFAIGWILVGIVTLCLIGAGIDIWKTRTRLMKKRKLREQVYPLAFTGPRRGIKRKTGLSAGMKTNTFTNNKTGEPLCTDDFLGFIVCGHDLEKYRIYHEDLVFVKKNFKIGDVGELPKLIVVKEPRSEEFYMIREIKSIKDNRIYIFDDYYNLNVVKEDRIVGIAEFDFKIL